MQSRTWETVPAALVLLSLWMAWTESTMTRAGFVAWICSRMFSSTVSARTRSRSAWMPRRAARRPTWWALSSALT